MKKVGFLSLVLLSFVLSACQKVSSEDIKTLFDQDLAAYDTTFKQAHGDSVLTELTIELEGPKVMVTVEGQNETESFDVRMDPVTQQIYKDKAVALDREDKQEIPAELSSFKELASLAKVKKTLESDGVDLQKLDSLELSNQFGHPIWEVNVDNKGKDVTYVIDGKTAKLIKKEID